MEMSQISSLFTRRIFWNKGGKIPDAFEASHPSIPVLSFICEVIFILFCAFQGET